MTPTRPPGDVALVTGGGSGLGRETCRQLVEVGFLVALADLPGSPGEEVAATLGDRVTFHALDVTDDAQVGQAIAAAGRRGRLRVAVNCAGAHLQRRLFAREAALTSEGFRQLAAVNLLGSFHVLRAAAEVMRETEADEDGGRGVVVLVSSAAAFDGQVGHIAYAGAKAGVAGMVLPAARELASAGIRVVAVAPGVFDTPMVAHLSEAERANVAAAIPHPSRLGRAEEFVHLIRHVIENPYLNGGVIRLDGAFRLPGPGPA